jgi:hypothetical protein
MVAAERSIYATGQAHGTHDARVDEALVAKARGAQVDAPLLRRGQQRARGRVRQKQHCKVLVNASVCVCGDRGAEAKSP